ncbi:Tight Junction Protein Zo-1 [Manis pentadactyla]|nr:Tight Junction Protein Zo-1 [Manis pentadactyla]
MPTRDREQWPLDGTLHLDTLTPCLTSSADSRGPPAVCSSYHALGLYPLIGPSFRWMSLLRPPQRSLPASLHCLRVLGIAPQDHGRSGDTPQENTDSSATRPAPYANEGTGSSGRLMELCTPGHPHACGFTSSADSRFRFRMSLLLDHTEIFCPLLVPLYPCPRDRIRSRSADEPFWPPQRSSARSRSTVSVSLGSPADHASADEPFGPPQRSSARFSLHCLRVLWDRSDHGLPAVCSSYHAQWLYPLIGPGRSGDTPQENTDSSATRLGPHANEGPEQWPLDGTLHPGHPHACGFTSSFLQTADFRWMSLLFRPPEISARFSFHCLRVLGIASDHGRSGDTPQENTDSSATRSLGPHANEGPEQWPLDGTLHPDTTRAASPLLQTADLLDEPFGPHRDLLPASAPLSPVLDRLRSRLLDEPLRAPTEIFCPLLHCLRVLGIAQITPADECLPAPTEIFCPLSFHCLRVSDRLITPATLAGGHGPATLQPPGQAAIALADERQRLQIGTEVHWL